MKHKKSMKKKAPLTITQQELQCYAELTRLLAVRSQLRLCFIERLEQGAEVEDGEMSVEMEKKSIKSSSWKRLVEILGKEEVEEIRMQVEASEVTRLLVRPCPAVSKGQVKSHGKFASLPNTSGDVVIRTTSGDVVIRTTSG